MRLSRFTAKHITTDAGSVPDEALFELPEKVLQFGSGVLLRGLPDYFIDKANKQGIFNGRIVVVKSTSQGEFAAFEKQDGLYTHCIRGTVNGEAVEEIIINASISRVLLASQEWEQVLECAHNPHLQIIVSNTTEVGIELVNDDVRQHPPKSFPGKLLAFLYERFKAFAGSEQSGLVIVPTETIADNGGKLQSVVFELAHLNGLEDGFIDWLERCNRFCNSLVDRIVTGKPDAEALHELEQELGYEDRLLIVSEQHRFWAIEGDEAVRKTLSFAVADKGIVIQPDIKEYQELKLRLLNGTHSFSCGLAHLAGLDTVRQSMEDDAFSSFITAIMLEEIAGAIPHPIKESVVQDFAASVLERFRNPSIAHHWLRISLNYTSKMRTRCVPLILRYFEQENTVPERMALGFAAFIYFTKPVVKKNNGYYGERNGELYFLQDDAAGVFYDRWTGLSTAALVRATLADKNLWDQDLSELPGFGEAVLEKLNLLLEGEVREAINSTQQVQAIARR